MQKILGGVLAVLLVLSALFYFRYSIFVVQPIGAVPEGRTLIIERLNRDAVRFIDSADAICEREQGGVNLLCRGAIMAAVAENTEIIARLPYIDWLYLVSTGGARYSN